MFENYEKYDERPMMHDFEENGWIGGESKTIMCQTAVNTEKGTMDDIEVCSYKRRRLAAIRTRWVAIRISTNAFMTTR